jgi:beta-glucosidase
VTSPSGRLPITFPARLEDTPAFGHYPGEDGKVVYADGTRVGYRHFDAFGIEPRFCFGHGLSYSSFRYDPPVVVAGSGNLSVDVVVTNTGDRVAAEVVQLYLRSAVRPERQLKGFTKVELAPGETGTARFDLDDRAFVHWDVGAGEWATGSGEFEILVGTSSRDIRHAVTVTV